MPRPREQVLPLFNTTYHLFTRRKDANAFRKKVGDDSPLPHAAGATWPVQDLDAGTTHVCIYLDLKWHEGKPEAELHFTKLHEAVHAAAMTLDAIGQAYDGESEVLPYLVEAIVRWLEEE